MDRCTVSTTYLGVKVNLEFKGGDLMSQKNGFISTSNPFVQAAIEAMPSFGHKIALKSIIKDEPAHGKCAQVIGDSHLAYLGH